MIEVVERPAPRGRNGKHGELYAALLVTLVTGKAVRDTSLSRAEISSARTGFQAKHPGLRMLSRQLPDGFYVWAEQRATSTLNSDDAPPARRVIDAEELQPA